MFVQGVLLMNAGSDMFKLFAWNTAPPIAAEMRDALTCTVTDTLPQEATPPEKWVTKKLQPDEGA